MYDIKRSDPMLSHIKFSVAAVTLAAITAALATPVAAQKYDERGRVLVQQHERNAKETKAKTKAKAKAKAKAKKKYSVGHRFKKKDVRIERSWQARGLPRPGRDEVYVIDGDDIYLAAAATLIIKALVD